MVLFSTCGLLLVAMCAVHRLCFGANFVVVVDSNLLRVLVIVRVCAVMLLICLQWVRDNNIEY